MLIGNGMLIHKLPMTFMGRHWTAFVGDTSLPGSTMPNGLTATAAIPDGYYAPQAFMMPRTAGSMSARFTVEGSGAAGGTAILALEALATIAGDGGVSSALGGLIVNLAATIGGGGTISDADMKAFLNLAATISGQGDIAATLLGLGALDALIEGAGDVDATLTAVGELEATLRGYGELTPEGLRDTVWTAIATNFNAAGTMGAKLNAASSAGDPWGATLPGAYPPGSAGAILGSYLADVWRRLGLDAANNQSTTRVGNVTTITDGTLTLTITEQLDGSVSIVRT